MDGSAARCVWMDSTPIFHVHVGSNAGAKVICDVAGKSSASEWMDGHRTLG